MDYMATTYVGQIEMKARKEAYKEAYDKAKQENYQEAYDKAKQENYQEVYQEVYQEKTNMVINMFKLNQSDENIHFVTQLPLEEIAQIRKANS